MEDAESLAQSAVERLSEDETLRGDLTDDGFSPLLDWAANAAIAYAQNLQSDKPDEAMDAYASRLKGVMQEVAAAAKAGQIDDPTPLLDFQMAQPDAAKAQLTSLKLAAGEDDANAIKITEVLSNALSATAQPTTEDKPAPAVLAPVPEDKPAPATPAPEDKPAPVAQTPVPEDKPASVAQTSVPEDKPAPVAQAPAPAASAPVPEDKPAPVAASTDSQATPPATPEPQPVAVSSGQPSTTENVEKKGPLPEVRATHQNEKEAAPKPEPQNKSTSGDHQTRQPVQANQIQAPSRSKRHSKKTPKSHKRHGSAKGKVKN